MGKRHTNISPLRRLRIIASVLRWYRKNGRSLPWRGERDPYRVLLSEVMLQQTQVSRVLLKYPHFLRTFPSLTKLAHARPSAVIKAWRGMGYNNRSLRLQTLARTVMQDFGGRIPYNIVDLQSLPGIGRYTAHVWRASRSTSGCLSWIQIFRESSDACTRSIRVFSMDQTPTSGPSHPNICPDQTREIGTRR